MTNNDSVASRIAERRAMLGWSQNKLANQSGVAPAQISRYEAGTNQPTKPVIAKLANALGVSFDWLAYGADSCTTEQGQVSSARDPQINVRLPQDLKDAVHNMAADNKRSVNSEIVAVLLEAVRRHSLSPLDGTEGMLLRAKEFLLPSEILEDIANRAAERALKLDREKK